MPTYQYACTAPPCGNRFELVQSFTDPNASECPTCGGPVRKVFSAVGVVFKGSGFYRNDSRKDAGKSSDSEPTTKTEPSSKPDAPGAKPAAASGDSAGSAKAPKSTPSSDSSSNTSSKPSTSAKPAAASA